MSLEMHCFAVLFSLIVYNLVPLESQYVKTVKTSYNVKGHGTPTGQSHYVKSVKTSYNNPYGNTHSSVKTSYSHKTSGVKTSHTNGNSQSYTWGDSWSSNELGGGDETFAGGCAVRPVHPLNGDLRCSEFSGCVAECDINYKFPNGKAELIITCRDGEWEIQGVEWQTIPACEPVCLPACENNGICVEPNQCNCPESFSGPQCQFENRPCFNLPPMPMNSRLVNCNDKACTVMCKPGHKFSDGSSITNLVCKGGSWVSTKPNMVSVSDCQPTCTPSCQNGGVCLSFDICQCPLAFAGPQCQYSRDACDIKKSFNGGFRCTYTDEIKTCTIHCPSGVDMEWTPAAEYVCNYASGKFQPSPVPQCLFGANVHIISSGSSSYSSSGTYYSSSSGISGGGQSSIAGFGGYGIKGQGWESRVNETITNNEIDGGGDGKNFYSGSKTQTFNGGTNGNQNVNIVVVETPTPRPGSCFTWGGAHYKTFDGKVFSFDSVCAHTLIRDNIDNTFNVVIQNSYGCRNSSDCYRIIFIYVQDKEYVLKKSGLGIPIFTSGRKQLPIPSRRPGIRVEMSANHIIVYIDTVGVTIKWDGHLLVQVGVTETMWNRTAGLCGLLDGDQSNDFVTKEGKQPKSVVTLASSWKVYSLDDPCDSAPTEQHKCMSGDEPGSLALRAQTFCQSLLGDRRFAACHSIMDTSILMDACRWDYCACTTPDPTDCACETMNVYVRECSLKKVEGLATWRDEDTCPMTCTGGRIYLPCAPPNGQELCSSVSRQSLSTNEVCEEGCYCPEGTVLHENKCIKKEKCPCPLHRKSYAPQSVVDNDCNTCTCTNGEWVCTEVACAARCGAIGDPHYMTFDGKKYDFMGLCSYYLLKGDDYSVEAENVGCPGSISAAMNFPISTSGAPSCTKTVIIKIDGHLIKLKQNRELTIDGKEITRLPYKVKNTRIRIASSIFILVEMANGLEVWWDGLTRVYVTAPASFKNKTKGLCGTFNNKQMDDFSTPEGDIEQSVVSFANKWKTNEFCGDIPTEQKSHPCEVNVHRKINAEHNCSKIKSDLFQECHDWVDPEPYYEDCLFDMCSCEVSLEKCFCTIISAYAKECAHKGVQIEWPNHIHECTTQCPGTQVYQVCGNSCTRTCSDVSGNPDCRSQCVDGCNCPQGETLDENGECIPIGECKCERDGLTFRPGYKEIRPASKAPELCTCSRAVWSCKPATPEEIKEYPVVDDSKTKCSSARNQEFTTCEPAEPVTCKNMHAPLLVSTAVCRPGCMCKAGYVFEPHSKECVLPSECPCHHGGKSYSEGETMQDDCNTCRCNNRKWDCTDRICAGICSAWGDSHYKTFDQKLYDYQGQCNYVFTKGSLGNNDSFDISIQNVPCGSLGVSCSKSITVQVGTVPYTESLTLTRDAPTPDHSTLQRMTLRKVGLFTIVEVEDLGLVLHWDHGTRIYVKLDPKWKNKVKGLCGNYNDNEMDDFQKPSGGVSEASANLFADSWKLQPFCPEPVDIVDTCERKPDRKVWATRKCGILKSSLFAACHSEVEVEPYLQRCIFDSCACDQGGDCECLCTALAAYGQQCNQRGVPVKWRSQELCPMQCDEECSTYSPCMSTCPVESCDNVYVYNQLGRLCKEDTCIEGCIDLKPCPEGQVRLNSTSSECVPRSSCRTVCLEIDGVEYFEGDLIEKDDCHRCYCSRHRKSCVGEPCTTVPYTTESTRGTAPNTENERCVDGWTEWLNQNEHVSKKGNSLIVNETEPIPSSITMNNLKHGGKCNRTQITDIECRAVRKSIKAKQTGLNVVCDLNEGLVCTSRSGRRECPDFKIRLLCICGTPTPTPPPPCDINRPVRKHPTDCSLYLICKRSGNTFVEVTQNCGNMLFNPVSQECDWPPNVVAIRPECKPANLRLSTSTMQTTLTNAECDINIPVKPHPDDCKLFYQCVLSFGVPTLVEQTCGIQFYNPESGICDSPEHVVRIKPECGENENVSLSTTTPATTSTLQTVLPTAECDINVRVKPHPYDCRFFYQCVLSFGVPTLVKQTCGVQFYNPESGVCDSPINVIRIKPECGNLTTTITPPTIIPSTERPQGCDLNDWLKEHPTNCSLYYECVPRQNGWNEYELRSCGSLYYDHILKRCEWPEVVQGKRPECRISKCPPGQIYSDCAIHCQALCVHYTYVTKREGKCLGSHTCEEGCISETRDINCPPGHFWRDNETCVTINNCLCVSRNGQPVLPGNTFRESECEICQCLNNQYVCDASSCTHTTAATTPIQTSQTTSPPTETTHTPLTRKETIIPYEFTIPTEITYTFTPETIKTSTRTTGTQQKETFTTPIIISTVTPPPLCNPQHYTELVDGDYPLSDEAFSASSSEPGHTPEKSRFKYKDSYWSPMVSDNHPYLQINLGRLEPVYGLVIKGNPTENQYVTAFRVLYSASGRPYSFMTDKNGKPSLFRGLADHSDSTQNIFDVPFETEVLRILPDKWNDKAAMKVELVGCGEGETSPSTIFTTTTPFEPMCKDIMGLSDNVISEKQISVSSELGQHTKSQLNINNGLAWQPTIDSTTEWVQFDFFEPRNITGVVTTGGNDGWVTAYKIKYSPNGIDWNQILDDQTKEEKVFLGNFDSSTPYPVYFERPLKAKMIRIIPQKWTNHIQMKIEPHGCYEPYAFTTESPLTSPTTLTTATTSPTTAATSTTPAITPGTHTVTPYYCGSCPGVQMKDLGENGKCLCENNMVWNGTGCVIPGQCPCIVGDRLYEVGTAFERDDCYQCICKLGGTTDCHKKECSKCEPGLQRVTTATCACVCKPCPPGQRLCPTSNICINNTAWCDGIQDCPDDETSCYTTPTSKPSTTAATTQTTVTPEPTTLCPTPSCPPGYNIKYENQTGECAKFHCELEEKDYVCNITGINIDTFDGNSIAYQICNHIVARHVSDLWTVIIKTDCTQTCSRRLIVKISGDEYEFLPHNTIKKGNYRYTTKTQIEKIGNNREYTIRIVGDALVFSSKSHGFWVIWGPDGKLKIGVASSNAGHVDGLCGYFNNDSKDDKRKKDGTQTRRTKEFGDSWALEGSQGFCNVTTCPLELQAKAAQICHKVKDEIFAPCVNAVDVNKFISQCFETACSCLQTAENQNAEKKCQCQALQNFVIECRSTDYNIFLSEWRVKTECPEPICPQPLIYADCHRKSCEPTCENIAQIDQCPFDPHVCFPGCYCPQGFVRKGEKCVEPTHCRDCKCDIWPQLDFVTFDKSNFSLNNNCTYIAVQNSIPSADNFQVLISNKQCRDNPKRACAEKITVIFNDHKIQVKKEENTDKPIIIVDGQKQIRFPQTEWVNVTQGSVDSIAIQIAKIQLLVLVYSTSMETSIQLPSTTYAGKLQGLCGDCNKNPADDFTTSEGVLTDNQDKFALSWLANRDDKDKCIKQEYKEECVFLSSELDPCQRLNDVYIFGECHPLVDPELYIKMCRQTYCSNKANLTCLYLEKYARQCSEQGVCVRWHFELCPSPTCPADREYQECGPKKQRTCEDVEKEDQSQEQQTSQWSQWDQFDQESEWSNLEVYEGCFCAEGTVLKDDVCVEAERCQECDSEGHYSGDSWQKDKCTTCECIKRNINCTKTECPRLETICQSPFEPMKVETGSETCCPKYICHRPTEEPCETPQPIPCARDQVAKLITRQDGCEVHTCQCKPPEECEPPVQQNTTLPGYESVVNKTGCCPFTELVCKPETCPEPEQCPEFYDQEKAELPGACCSINECKPPKTKCLYKFKHSGKQVQVYGLNETWKDGPCHECRCIETESEGYHSSCSVTKCPSIEDAADRMDYVIEEVAIENQCCPNFIRSKCKDGDNVYEIGGKWFDKNDHCHKVECDNSSLGAYKKYSSVECNDKCEQGSMYTNPENGQCCGICKVVACVFEGVTHDVNKVWNSSDNCKVHKCLQMNETVLVETKDVVCPSPDDEFEYIGENLEGECCKKYVRKACKVGNETYQIGEEWQPFGGDKCTKIKCIANDKGEISKQEVKEPCVRKCNKGMRYVEPSPESSKCCGECVPYACVLKSGTEHEIGSNWYSDDNCTTYYCNLYEGETSVRASTDVCPKLDNCPKANIYKKGCCEFCNKTSDLTKCLPTEMNLGKTVELIREFKPPHGHCSNKKPLSGLTECRGVCDSSTYYDTKTGFHENLCTCCQATKFHELLVPMECEDGYHYQKRVHVPLTCGCEDCASKGKTTKGTKGGGKKGGSTKQIKGGIKTGIKTSHAEEPSPE